MRIIGVDPGGTTGIATFTRNSTEDDGEWWHVQLVGEHHVELYDLLEDFDPHYIICERFFYQRRELDQGVSLNLDAVEYIGVVKLWHSRHFETVDLVMQTPMKDNPGKNFWTNDKIEKLGLYRPNAVHAMDATRHLLYWLLFTRKEQRWVEALRPLD